MNDETSKPSRRSRWIKLGISIGLVTAVTSLILYLNSGSFRDRVRQRLVGELEKVTGGRVELKNFVWNFSRLQFEFDDLTIHGLEKPGDIPYAHVDHARVSVKIISVFGREISLRELYVEHPVAHLIVYPDGSTNQASPKRGTGSASPAQPLFSIRMDRLRVGQGVLVLNEQRIPLDLSADGVTAGMTYSAHPHPNYAGTIRAGSLLLRHPGYPQVLSQAETNFTISNNEAQISSLRWTSGKSKVEASGTIADFRNPRVETKYRGTLELSELSKILGIRELRSGVVELNGTARYLSSEDFFGSGKLTLKNGEYSGSGLRLGNVDASSEYSVAVDRITLAKLNGRALGGSFNGNASISHWSQVSPKTGFSSGKLTQIAKRQPQGTLELNLSGISLAEGLRALLSAKSPLNQLRIASTGTGKVQMRWTGALSDADTVVDLDARAITPAPASELPLTGSVHATYHGRSDRIDVTGVNLAARATRISATGAIGSESQLRVSLNTSDLSEIDAVAHALSGERQKIPAMVHGQASFNGTLTGKLIAPTIAGRLQATDFDTTVPAGPASQTAPAGPSAFPTTLHWDSLLADVTYSPSLISTRNLLLKRGTTQIAGSAIVGLREGQLDPDSHVEARLRVHDADLQELQHLVGIDYPVTGRLNGETHVAGTLDNLSGLGHIQVTGGSIYAEPYRSLSADLQFQGKQVDLRNVILQQNGGRATGGGNYNFDSKVFAFNVTGSNFDLAHLSKLQAKKLSIGGHAEFAASGSGTISSPTVNANLSITGLLLGGEPAGDLHATAVTHGTDLHLEAHTNMQLATANVTGDVHLRQDFPAEIHLDLGKLDFDPLLRAYLPGKVTGHSSVSGRFVLRGPLKRPRDIGVEADVDQFQADVQHIQLHNDGPLRFSINNQVASVQQMHIVGTDTDITGTGRVELFGSGRLDLHANGKVNLGILQTVNPAVSSSGQMTFTVNATGRLNDPNFAGNVQIANGAIAFVDLPNGLSEINGSLNFDRNRLRVQKLTARTGGGDLVLGGYVTYSNGIFFDLTATGRDIRIRYPEGVSSQATADLRLVGNVQNSVLSGDVTVTKFGLTPQFDLASYVQRAKQPTNPPTPNSLIDNVRLDVHIVSTPELRLETSMARVSGDMDIRLRGTAARPSVLGRVSIAEGDITFNSTTYHLERGDVLFANPVRIEPVANVEASARVRDYDITLGFHGTPDKLNVTYRSEPPLPSADIIALLAFGRTRQEGELAAEQGSQSATSETFAQTASNAILGEALNAAVSSRVQKLFGISRIKIDPNLGGTGSEGNPNARLTVEQQISKNVTVTYLTNLGQYAQEVLQVEYNINKNVALVAVRDYTGVLAIDLRIRQRKR
ncbi:MAG: hypothetical protein DMG60_05145 [Acidobacteria bacterium]|nr:MAG: hypothetical protein DMG60_05145 [Acidobacteriota bacterium]